MYDMDDMCSACYQTFGQHIRLSCAKGGTAFTKAFTLKDCKVGDQVRYQDPTDPENPIGHFGTVTCHSGGSVLMAWKEKDNAPVYAWLTKDLSGPDKKHVATYVRAYYLLHYTIVFEVLNGQAVSPVRAKTGMRCSGRFCGIYNDYAEPNRPDGSFVCFSCRQSGR